MIELCFLRKYWDASFLSCQPKMRWKWVFSGKAFKNENKIYWTSLVNMQLLIALFTEKDITYVNCAERQEIQVWLENWWKRYKMTEGFINLFWHLHSSFSLIFWKCFHVNIYFFNKLCTEWTVPCILRVQSPASRRKLQVITKVNGNSKVQNSGLWNNWMIICSQTCFLFLRWILCMRENLC